MAGQSWKETWAEYCLISNDSVDAKRITEAHIAFTTSYGRANQCRTIGKATALITTGV